MQRQSEQQIVNLKIKNEQEIYSRIIESRLTRKYKRVYKNDK